MTNAVVEQYLEPVLPSLTPVPAEQPGICSVCRSALNDGYTHCYHCSLNSDARVLPISMSIHREGLHHHLRSYKDGPSNQRPVFTVRLAALVAVFLDHHEDCVGAFDEIATVPSDLRNAPQTIIDRLRRFDNCARGLLTKVDGAYVASTRVKGQRVLVFDDTFTSGQSAFRACQAIRSEGGTVVGPLVIGRHVQPEYRNSKPMTERLRKISWDRHQCGVCGGVILDPPIRTGLF